MCELVTFRHGFGQGLGHESTFRRHNGASVSEYIWILLHVINIHDEQFLPI